MAPGNGRQPQLEDLDDALLLQVFASLTPLPDLFNVAASCRRFRDLALDRRSWLYVTHAAPAARGLASPPARRGDRPQQPPPAHAASAASLGGLTVDDSPHWYRSQFGSLAEAVAASRPGDTILLEAGPAPHAIAAPIVVPHPVHILGGGASAGECMLEGARGIEALLDFRASGRLANLTLRATASASCVTHSRGRLTVQGCTLECDPCGLPHLAAALRTQAVSWPARPPAAPAAAAGPLAGERQRVPGGTVAAAAQQPPPAKRLRAQPTVGAGAGVLSVVETRIKSSGTAVDLRGSGRLSDVRVLLCSGHALVWLEVDSSNCDAVSAAAATAAAAACTAGPATPAAAAAPPKLAPSWVGRAAAAGFDAAAFQRRAAALVAGGGPTAGAEPPLPKPAAPQQQPAASSLESKAEEWCVLHHSALAPGTSVAAPVPPQKQD